MKILLFGKNGQVGWELQRSLLPLGKIIAPGHRSPSQLCGDLTNLAGIQQTIREVAPDIIVNAAAYTAVDKAESELENADIINHQAPALMAAEALKLNACLIHYSTDYVFDGSGDSPRLESDNTNPINCYGRSKLMGEVAISQSGCKHYIFRTSWVYGLQGNNFVKIILRLAAERDQLNIVSDQIGVPTGADLLADVTAHAIQARKYCFIPYGIYHLASKGETSWYDYARFVIDKAQNLGSSLKVQTVSPISSREYPTPAQRPLNSRLNTNKFHEAFSLDLPFWEIGVERMLTIFLGLRS